MRTVAREIVGAFVVTRDNHMLLGKSRKGGVYPDLWLVPGGGLEPGETHQEGMLRELREETGLVVPSAAKITRMPEINTGESEKIIDGEQVRALMTFHDFWIDIPEDAAVLTVTASDDFGEVRWIPFDELSTISMGAVMRRTLQKRGVL